MPQDGLKETVSSKRPIDMKKVRRLLAEDIRKFCDQDAVIHALDKNGSPEVIQTLQKAASAPNSDGELRVYSAIALAVFENSAGLEILKDSKKYWTTNSQIEELHTFTGRILLGEASAKGASPGLNWRQMSPKLTAEIFGH